MVTRVKRKRTRSKKKAKKTATKTYWRDSGHPQESRIMSSGSIFQIAYHYYSRHTQAVFRKTASFLNMSKKSSCNVIGVKWKSDFFRAPSRPQKKTRFEKTVVTVIKIFRSETFTQPTWCKKQSKLILLLFLMLLKHKLRKMLVSLDFFYR